MFVGGCQLTDAEPFDESTRIHIFALFTRIRHIETVTRQSLQMAHLTSMLSAFLTLSDRPETQGVGLLDNIIGQSIYAKLWLNQPQIATEAFSSDLLPERCPE